MPRNRPPVSLAKRLAFAGLLAAAGLHAQTLGPGVPTVSNVQDAAVDREVKRFTDVYALVQSYAADPIDNDVAVYQGAVPGLLRRLDPHSVFFNPDQFQQLKQMETSTSKGFGSVVSILPGRVIVLQALPGTPSSRSGISPGDEIVAVNNIRLDQLNMDQLIEVLTASRQKPAQLYVRRSGSARLLQFTLVPEEMQTKSVDRAFALKPGVGYIHITSWEAQTGDQLHEAIESLGGAKLQGLVLDLRANPGGIVNAALQAASFFLEPRQKIFSIRGRKKAPEDVNVPGEARPYRFQLAVLVNEKSASASEIVAGALQDHDRATIIGLPSYGKGLVQSVFPLSEKTGLALTTALYYTPSGRSIQKPLQGGDFELSPTAAHPNQQAEFKTDKGRAVRGGGGIIPDIIVGPERQTRLRIALDASGSFVSFATEYIRSNQIDDKFEVTPELLDQFQSFAAQHNIQPGVSEWAADRPFIERRLKVEILNQGLGVEKGDEADAPFDPAIKAALEAFR